MHEREIPPIFMPATPMPPSLLEAIREVWPSAAGELLEDVAPMDDISHRIDALREKILRTAPGVLNFAAQKPLPGIDTTKITDAAILQWRRASRRKGPEVVYNSGVGHYRIRDGKGPIGDKVLRGEGSEETNIVLSSYKFSPNYLVAARTNVELDPADLRGGLRLMSDVLSFAFPSEADSQFVWIGSEKQLVSDPMPPQLTGALMFPGKGRVMSGSKYTFETQQEGTVRIGGRFIHLNSFSGEAIRFPYSHAIDRYLSLPEEKRTNLVFAIINPPETDRNNFDLFLMRKGEFSKQRLAYLWHEVSHASPGRRFFSHPQEYIWVGKLPLSSNGIIADALPADLLKIIGRPRVVCIRDDGDW